MNDQPNDNAADFRSFKNSDQSSGILIQINTSIDIPGNISVISPDGVASPKLKSVWQVGIHAIFNWRHYFK